MKFVLNAGPPAVGKMAVGLELSALTGFKLFHNHASIDAALSVFSQVSFVALEADLEERLVGPAPRRACT